jgi:hypothetical protein
VVEAFKYAAGRIFNCWCTPPAAEGANLDVVSNYPASFYINKTADACSQSAHRARATTPS